MQKRVTKDGGRKVAAFFKRNIYYVLMIMCVIVIGTMITVAAVVNKDDGGGNSVVVPPDNGNDVPPVIKPVEFILGCPVGKIDVMKRMTTTEMLEDKTTGDFTGHSGVDLAAAAGSIVSAPFAGTVESVVSDGSWGTVVVIDHGNGYKSTLKLMQDVSVIKGKVLAKGDIIGKITDTASQEKLDGAHLHYELTQAGKLIDPMQFMPGSDK